MRRRRRDHHCRFPDLEMPGPVRDRNSRTGPALGDLLDDPVHLADRHLGIGLVFEMLDLATARVIADRTNEGHDAAGIPASDP